MYMNGDPIRKSIEKIFKKKVVDGCIQEALFDQCICGNKEFVKVIITTFLRWVSDSCKMWNYSVAKLTRLISLG